MSLYFDGDINSYLSIPNVDGLDFGTGDFTIEWWMYQIDNNRFPRVFQIGNYGTVSIGLSIEESPSTIYFWANNSLYNLGNNPFNTWTHVAISRYAGVTFFYINGVQVSNFSDTNDYVSGLDLLIGNETDRSQEAAYTGYILGFSWSKGISRYMSNFTPPLQLPVVDSYTQFILGGSGGVGGPLAGSIVNSNVLLDQTLLPEGYTIVPPDPVPEPVPSNPFVQPLRRQCCLRLVFGVDEKKTEKKGYTRTLTSNYGTLGRRRR